MGSSRARGLWWSVVHNKLKPGDLDLLREAWPQFQWVPLTAVVTEYGQAISEACPEPLLTRSVAACCRHAGLGECLVEAYEADSFVVRCILNRQTFPPTRGECPPHWRCYPSGTPS